MNKVVTINLGGNAYQLEEAGYDILRSYLETAATRLQNNPDRDEILSDIEGAVGEKFRALLASHKTVIVTKEVTAVLAEMGPIEAEANPEPGAAPGSVGGSSGGRKEQGAEPGAAPRRLYRIQEGAMIAGVCNGIAAYFNLDPSLVRLAFVLLTIFWGTGVLIYIVMAIVVPEAISPEQKAAASGSPATAQEFIRRAKEGYYEATKNFPDRKAQRAWARQFSGNMRAWADQWRYHWQPGCIWPGAGCQPAMGMALPLLSLLNGAITVLWISAFISLLATGAVFGAALPANVPVWVAALVLFMAYAILSGSLKSARRICLWGLGPPRGMWSFVFLVDAAVWLVVVIALAWLAVRYFPELRDAIHTIPAQAHQAADDIRNWWKGR